MLFILFFRVCIVIGFLLATWRWGDWKNWEKYYATALFTMIANLGVCFITYHHILWNYNPDALIKTHTTVELINSFILLPATTFIYLSKFPSNDKVYQYGYIIIWVSIFSGLEFIDQTLGGISYKNGWSWLASSIFDCAIFPILRLHYLRPLWAWIITFLLTVVILVLFDFASAEMK